ncbi:MAG: protein phosphatase CheZ [Lautropia sp.]
MESPVYRNLGELTRRLHEVLNELGALPSLQAVAEQMPDARTRLGRIAELTGQSAEKVLDAVDAARAEQERLAAAARLAQARPTDGGGTADAARGYDELAALALQTAERTGACLTDIMMAQDFHDLTTQILQRVVAVAQDVESNLLAILVSAAPPEKREPATGARALQGPAVPALDVTGRVDGQQQVDDLLESLGF